MVKFLCFTMLQALWTQVTSQTACEPGDTCATLRDSDSASMLQTAPGLRQHVLAEIRANSHSTCYIAECGCPPFGDDKPSWCGRGDAAVNGDWCQESEERCMQCNGYWLNGGGAPGSTCIAPPALLQGQAKKTKAESHSTCYIAECGCPPFGDDKPSWCGRGDAAVNGDWCQE